MTIIVDYGLGNVGSILNILHIIGEKAKVSRDSNEILSADRIILPGVGAFDVGMENLAKYNLIEPLKKAAKRGIPFLGICLGMQLLGASSEEGLLPGLGLIPFKTLKFTKEKIGVLKVPHMGWDITKDKALTPLTICSNELQRYYFVHSYYAECDNKDNILMTCDYGIEFAAAVYNKNVFGVQFHPEKSHNFGIEIFKRFVRINKDV